LQKKRNKKSRKTLILSEFEGFSIFFKSPRLMRWEDK
jgi:hypothetical protein